MKIEKTALIAGNWKMNGTIKEAKRLVSGLLEKYNGTPSLDAKILICPPMTLLNYVGNLLEGTNIMLGGQNCHYEVSGAHTGEVSANMMRDSGCSHVIVGHSERRSHYGETDKEIFRKVEAVVEHGMKAIMCVGETLKSRQEGNAINYVTRQLDEVLNSRLSLENLVIAYEPIWAIGSGKTPEISEIVEIHEGIKKVLSKSLSQNHEVPVIYGGSVNPTNAEEVLGLEAVNGVLVGGASLNTNDFWEIVNAAS